MASANRKYTSNNRRTSLHNSNEIYTYGNTARRLNTNEDFYHYHDRYKNPNVASNREKLHHMNLGYVAFLVVALLSSAIILGNYIKLQAELTAKTTLVSTMEKQLNSLKLSNDEEYNRITSSIDLEEVKKTAIGELGMVYASEGQIVTYSDVSNDYMREITEN